ncbi:MAG: hypothetical protein Q7R73_02305 [bacterium]|nr:hypothetical protein [bacterium]
MKINGYTFLFSVLLLFVFAGVLLHGFIGAFLPMDRGVYCAVSETIMRVDCPLRSEPMTRADFNASVFKNLSQARNSASIFFQLLLFVILLVGATVHGVAPAAPLLGDVHVFQNFIPPDFISRLKLRRWSRQLAQSPALLRA